MSQSNVPTLTIDGTGITAPTTGELQAGALADINAAFGGNLDIKTVGTPQESLSEDIAEYVADKNAAIVQMGANFDPNTAEGRWQDAIARLYYLYRKGATASVVVASCVGAPLSTLPAGSTATDTVNGNTWVSLAAAQFSSGGTLTTQFACTTLGPVALPIGALTQIAVLPSGVQWDAITNLGAAVLGSNTESQADFEYRRFNSVAINGHGSPASVFGAVANVAGVTDCFVIDNPKGATVNYGATNYPLAPHSIYVAVVGGANQDIVNAMWSKKDLGCDYNGNTTGTVVDTSSLASPQPSYTVTYEQPAALSIQFAVQIKNSPSLPSNIVALVQAAILNAFSGGDGGPRARIGSILFASRYYAPVVTVNGTQIQVVSILMGSAGGGATNNSVSVGIDQVPTLAQTDIAVALV